MRVEISNGNGEREELDAWPTLTPGLVLTRALHISGEAIDEFTITHLASGMTVGLYIENPEQIARVAGELGSDDAGPIDWTRTGDEIQADPRCKARVVELMRQYEVAPMWVKIGTGTSERWNQ